MKPQDILIAKPATKDEADTLKAFLKALKIKFEVAESPYKKEFVQKIKRSRAQAKKGKTVKVILDEIWK
ncbi:MAG: hypothetical protein K2X48_15920 [Chitinophagaceae bacterium]|nr:hypothetical protein [Chitinophagaceae bacterium]